MEILNKLFVTKKYEDILFQSRDLRPLDTSEYQVRLLLFKETDYCGRKLLFDSKTIEKCKYEGLHEIVQSSCNTQLPHTVEVTEGYEYKYKGPSSDANILGDMIFGAVAMKYKGSSIKIHILKNPLRLMCSKVFIIPSSKPRKDVSNSSAANSDNNINLCTSFVNNMSKGVDVHKSITDEGIDVSLSFERGDSGFSGCDLSSGHSSISSSYGLSQFIDDIGKNVSEDDLFSFYSPSCARKLSISSNGSWQRRMYYNMSTRFDLVSQATSSSNQLTVPGMKSNSSYESQEYSKSDTEESLTTLNRNKDKRKNVKLGLALMFIINDNKHLELCLQHILQMESLMCRVWRISSQHKPSTLACLTNATQHATMWFHDLLWSARITPVWLKLVSSNEKNVRLADSFLTNLCTILTAADTKHTNFFISTLLTYVLTYHLGWVSTVSPYELFTNSSKHIRDKIRKKHPYNAFWAQLSDLCGSIGFPPKNARTIVFGNTDKNLVNKVLYSLTYFIRCGQINKSNLSDTELFTTKVESKINKTNSDKINCSSGLKRTNTQYGNINLVKKCDISLSDLNRNSSDFSSEESSLDECISQLAIATNDEQTVRRDSPRLSVSPVEEKDDNRVVFVLGDDERLIGIKNKSSDGKNVKKSVKPPAKEKKKSNCCSQKERHCKHSGYKFEFDRYPQIVMNYMKSKNLEILDRHFIGKPGNLKFEGFQMDPTIVPPIKEEMCASCLKCQNIESQLQTPSNASELKFTSDMPGQSDYYFAKELIHSEPKPNKFVRKKLENTVVISAPGTVDEINNHLDGTRKETKAVNVTEFTMPTVDIQELPMNEINIGYQYTLLGALTDRYIPDRILQGTTQNPSCWESNLLKDLELTTFFYKTSDCPVRSLAIVADMEKWSVRLLSDANITGGGMSTLVASMLDALPIMRKTKIAPYQCLAFIESKLRELCVLSKTLADMLMSTDFCDMDSLTKSLNVDLNDIPLLMAIATTHTPQIALRYGISYR